MRAAAYRVLSKIVAGALLVAALVGNAAAADYPTRRVTLVVGFAAGGAVDVAARIIAQELGTLWGQTVVVENRPGAESNLAARAVAQAAPDGYTLLVASTGIAINQSLYKRLDYSIAQLTPVAIPALGDGLSFAVVADHPAQTLRAFIEGTKDKSFTVGAGGAFARITSEYFFKVLAKAPSVAVPFPGGAPALTALVGRHIDALAAPVPEVIPQVRQGAVRVLAVSSAKRSLSLPEVPTLSELGYAGIEVGGMTALLAPAGTPDDICQAINAAVNQAMQKPDVRERLRQLGYEANPVSRAAAKDYLARQLALWARMVGATGISVD